MVLVNRELNALVQNVRAGARIALFRRDAFKKILVSADQVFYLAVLDVLIVLALAWVDALPMPEFNAWGFASEGLGFAALFAVGYLFARLYRKKAFILRFVVAVYCISPWFSFVAFAVKKSYVAWAQMPWVVGFVWWASVVWFFAVIGWILIRLAGKHDWRVGVTLAGFIVFSLSTASMHVEFFYAGKDADEKPQHKRLNAEEVFDAQPELLRTAARTLRAGRPGVPELYFLGFASYASQDVFKKEAMYAKDLLDSRFETRGRSLVMINHADTANDIPLASSTNLRRMLKTIGGRMNVKEDVLFVYLTSHGSEKRGLAAQLWPLSLNDIPAEKLKAYLDEAGIKWRVLLISACYSGNFVEVLKDDFTLVMTASAADKQSFGCSNARDFTYFGEAVFKDALNGERAFIPAFKNAIVAINQREAKEKLSPSSPQLSIGTKIAAKLSAIERGFGPVPAPSATVSTPALIKPQAVASE